MKIGIMLVTAVLLMAYEVNASSVVISQVLYDPVNSESGGEAIELYNPTPAAVDISNWVIMSEASPTDATIPASTILSSGGYYLIADIGWSTGRDDLSWPEADYEEALILSNTDAGVAVSNRSHIIDAVGWGNAIGIDAGLYEGTPATPVSEGEALRRINDTDDNAADFAASTPFFHRGSDGSTLTVLAIVEGSAPRIDSFAVTTDDDSTPGIQVNPIPKQNKSVVFEATISHPNGIGYIKTVMTIVGNQTKSIFQINALNETTGIIADSINLSYAQPAGNYTLMLVVTDNAGFSTNVSAQFTYQGLIAMELDASELVFAAMPGETPELIGDSDISTNNLTLLNVGNAAFDIELAGTNLSSESSVIPVDAIEYTFNGDYAGPLAGQLSGQMVARAVGVLSSDSRPLSFRLSIPHGTTPGNYTGTITLVAVKP